MVMVRSPWVQSALATACGSRGGHLVPGAVSASKCQGSLSYRRHTPYRQPFLFSHVIAAAGPMSTALPCTWAEYFGGSTHRVASLYEPYFLIAAFSSRCCFVALRRAEVMLIRTPSDFAAAIALVRRAFSFGD